jgi:hypothetical protein
VFTKVKLSTALAPDVRSQGSPLVVIRLCLSNTQFCAFPRRPAEDIHA